jgi:hypothetical protein
MTSHTVTEDIKRHYTPVNIVSGGLSALLTLVPADINLPDKRTEMACICMLKPEFKLIQHGSCSVLFHSTSILRGCNVCCASQNPYF